MVHNGTPQDDAAAKLLAILEAEPEIDVVGGPLAVRIDDEGHLSLEGEVRSVAAKRRAVERAGVLADVITIVDRVRVAPERRFGDEEIRRRLLDLLGDEAAFADYDVRGVIGSERSSTPARSLTLRFRVEDGVVFLDGMAGSLEHKRLAGVLAWWTPGTRDVLNRVVVEPPEADGDGELTEAVRTALDKDPLVDGQAIEVLVAGGIVRLAGVVRTDEERHVAETDAWYVLGVDDVINDLRVEQ